MADYSIPLNLLSLKVKLLLVPSKALTQRSNSLHDAI